MGNPRAKEGEREAGGREEQDGRPKIFARRYQPSKPGWGKVLFESLCDAFMALVVPALAPGAQTKMEVPLVLLHLLWLQLFFILMGPISFSCKAEFWKFAREMCANKTEDELPTHRACLSYSFGLLGLLLYLRIYTYQFARRALQLAKDSPYLKDAQQVGPHRAFCSESAARELFKSNEYTCLSDDAELLPFAHYLRGCQGLRIPPLWRPLLPEKLCEMSA